MKEKILELAKKYDLSVSLIYKILGDKVLRNYWFTNSPYQLEVFFDSEDFKNLNMHPEKFAYELFCIYNVRHTQENEFFID